MDGGVSACRTVFSNGMYSRMRSPARTRSSGLEALGGNLYRQTLASGTPVTGVPADPGFGRVHQGYLENSNVDPVKEITELIQAQRAYEMNSKVIQAADEMYSTVARNLR